MVIFGKDTTEKQLQIGKSVISSRFAATSLGCILDSKLNMSQHVSRVCKSANYYLHCIRKIRNFISMDVCKLLVHTLVMERLDYCNALLNNYSVVFSDVTIYMVLLYLKVNFMIALICRAGICVLKLYQYPNG